MIAGLGKAAQRLIPKAAASAAQSRKDTLMSVLPGAGINLGLGLLSGDPVQGLMYGVGDLALNYPAMRLAHRISPGQKVNITDPKTGNLIAKNRYEATGLETGVNFGASFGSNAIVSALMPQQQQTQAAAQEFLAQQAQQVNPALQSQPQQLSQQIQQRSTVNQLPLNQQNLSPNTMYQMQGLEHTKFHYPGVTLPPELLEQLQSGERV